ncbi:RlmE family RNA methyltransferase, partial [bacterium]|nr:RlmE family RNA methyltransferase [bacterium]
MKKVQDHYFQKAKQEGFAARSAYKLQEIDQKHKILSNGNYVLDLGCFPGSWMQYISQNIGKNGRVVGIDRTELKIHLKENMRFVHSDINDLDLSTPGEYADRYHVICSDMAPNTTGNKNVDAERSIQLCETALYIARHWLMTRGTLLVKALQGGPFDRFLKQMREEYSKVKIVKPKSSRSESKEIFVLGLDKKTILIKD